MVTIRFGGNLRRFGRKYELSVATAAEGLKGLLLQLPGLKAALGEGYYRVRVAGVDINGESVQTGLHSPLSPGDTVTVVPVIAGAGGGGMGIGMAILGTVLIGASLFIPAIAAYSATLASAMLSSGIALASSGVSMLLTKMPATNPSVAGAKNITNNYFSSQDNRIGQGVAVPLLYGQMVIGSNVISQGLETE